MKKLIKLVLLVSFIIFGCHVDKPASPDATDITAVGIVGQIRITDSVEVSALANWEYEGSNELIEFRIGNKLNSRPKVYIGNDIDHWISFEFLTGNSWSKSKTDTSAKFTLSDLLTVEYFIQGGRIKEIITLLKNPPKEEFSFKFALSDSIYLQKDLSNHTVHFFSKTDSSLQFLMTIDRQAFDANGDSANVNFNVSLDTLTLSLPRAKLDAANYPVVIDPTVSTTTSVDGVWSPTQRFAYHANGYYWVIFYQGSFPVLYSSSDGSTFSLVDTVSADTLHVDTETDYSARFLADTMIVAFGDENANRLYYRKATLKNDGTVTLWPTSTDEHIATDGLADARNNIAVDSENNPWAGGVGQSTSSKRFAFYEGTAGLESTGWTLRNPGNSSAFTTVSGQCVIFDVGSAGDMYGMRDVIHGSIADHRDILGIEWDQSLGTWGTWTAFVNNDLSNSSQQYKWSATKTSNGKLHVLYIDKAGNINHREGTDATPPIWSVIDADVTGLTSHTKLTVSADGNDLFVFYDKGDEKIYYREYTGSWGSESTLKTNTTAIQSAITSYESARNNEIGVVWVQGASSPYDVVFDKISVAAAPARRIFIVD